MRVRSTFLKPDGARLYSNGGVTHAPRTVYVLKSHDSAANLLNKSGVIAFGMLRADYRVKNCFIRLSIYRVNTASVGVSNTPRGFAESAGLGTAAIRPVSELLRGFLAEAPDDF
jgi:hypothetical protein